MSGLGRPHPQRFHAQSDDSDWRWWLRARQDTAVIATSASYNAHNPHTTKDSVWSRSFLKRPAAPNIPIQAIGLSLYEQLPSSNPSNPVETPGTKVTRTQWLDLSSLEMANLVGKNILIVDEVDDTRTTLEYAVKELQKDVQTAADKLGTDEKTQFSIFVLHVSLTSGRNDLRNASELMLRDVTSEQGQD